MLPTYAQVYADIAARAESVLPGLAGTYRTQKLNRQNWENLVNEKKLATPYLIIESGRSTSASWAMDTQAYGLSIALYYVRDLSENAVEETAALMDALRDAFWSSPLSTCSLMGQVPTVDVTETNPANLVFYNLQANKFAGMVSFDVLVGAGIYG